MGQAVWTYEIPKRRKGKPLAAFRADVLMGSGVPPHYEEQYCCDGSNNKIWQRYHTSPLIIMLLQIMITQRACIWKILPNLLYSQRTYSPLVFYVLKDSAFL